jgi:hypothetical protein
MMHADLTCLAEVSAPQDLQQHHSRCTDQNTSPAKGRPDLKQHDWLLLVT